MSRAGTSAPSGALQQGPRVRNDADLIAACRLGDDAAWEELVERFSPFVYGIAARGYGLGHTEAEGVFQEVFARTYEHLRRVGDEPSLRQWIGQLAHRLSADRLRGTGGVPAIGPVDPPGVEEVLDRFREALDARDALAGLPEDCREILERFFCRDESYTTIATALNVLPGEVATRISRSLTLLSELLEGREPPVRPSRGRVTR